jgi:mannosyltransferase OCH1-like enzyme
MSLKIPKRIIQTSRSADLTIQARAAVATIRLLNPDFEYLFFDDRQIEQFLGSHFPEHRAVFHSFPYPIQRIDFFRYLAIYQLGGFYFDLDVFLAKKLEDLLEFGCVFPFEELTINDYLWRAYGMDWEIGNYAFGAAPGHPFMGEIIQNCLRAQKDPGWTRPMVHAIPRPFRERYQVLCSTGPGLVSRTLAEYPEAARQVKVLFPDRVWDRTLWHRFGSYGIHLMEGSWARKQNPFMVRLTRLWERRKLAQVIDAGKKRGDTRALEFRRATSQLGQKVR